LVDELLLLARFENQKQHYKIENVFLNALILDSLSRYSDKISSQKIKISTHLKEEFYVQTDYYLISIIVGNLLSNAIKYSKPKGTIHISIEKDKSQTSLTINDNGLGIPSDDLNKIFNSFYRADNIKNSMVKGTGLGLSIVKRLCDILKITIEISSEENIGTTLKLRIP